MKFVKVELHYSGKQYEYQTSLNMQVGKTYKITVIDGWTPPMRVRVISVSNKPEYPGVLSTIGAVEEVEGF